MMKVLSATPALAAAGLLLFVAALVAAERATRGDADAQPAASTVTSTDSMAGMDMTANTKGSLTSYAGASPENADQLAAAHVPYPAALQPAPAGDTVKVHMTLKDVNVQIAPGITYAAWGFDGGAPGPVVHVRQGQTVEMTLTNGGAIPHSIDFHAARIAPNEAFTDVMPGASFRFSFKANDPGVFMYHCGTKPVLAYIANGMYGAIVVVDPVPALPKADREYVLVASEWYLDSPGLTKPSQLDFDKAREMMPDWVTFNGYAGQYVKHP